MTNRVRRSYKQVMNDELDTRLRQNRYEPSDYELDSLKRRAMAKATKGSRSRARGGSRALASFLALGVMMSGGTAVVAATSGGSDGGQRSASVSQYEQIVAGERIVPGTARLRGPSGCPPRAFYARVTGQNIARVVFRLDGRRIRTLTRPNAGSTYRVRVNPARLRVGVHRITATITFTQATRKRPETRRISFQRCARRLAAPRFTG